ncbi:MAG: flavin reductase [Chloroflexi bacterium]|nr:flavin reductase [Chloroflexota bacterium]
MPPTKEEFRRAMGLFATGVTVVTTRLGDTLHGMTANAVCSVSLEPLMVLVCVDQQNDTHDLLQESGIFAVNILSEKQQHLAETFAIKRSPHDDHRLESLPLRFGSTGAPILEGCLAYLDCRVVAQYPGGDHTIFLGQVVEVAAPGSDDPLLYFQSRYASLAE